MRNRKYERRSLWDPSQVSAPTHRVVTVGGGEQVYRDDRRLSWIISGTEQFHLPVARLTEGPLCWAVDLDAGPGGMDAVTVWTPSPGDRVDLDGGGELKFALNPANS
jgi:hypothetical protein